MTFSQFEYDATISSETKRIEGDINWGSNQKMLAVGFRHDIDSDEGFPLFLQGWYNPYSGKLSYTIIHRGAGRIYGLDLGAEHRNPDGCKVGETHKNFWTPGHRDKWAYAPEDITHSWVSPLKVWEQFCAEVKLKHLGEMLAPVVQGKMLL